MRSFFARIHVVRKSVNPDGLSIKDISMVKLGREHSEKGEIFPVASTLLSPRYVIVFRIDCIIEVYGLG